MYIPKVQYTLLKTRPNKFCFNKIEMSAGYTARQGGTKKKCYSCNLHIAFDNRFVMKNNEKKITSITFCCFLM